MTATRRRQALAVLVGLVTAATVVSVSGSGPATAGSYRMTVIAPSEGGIGVDAIYSGGGGGGAYDIDPCSTGQPNGNKPTLGWDASGQLVGTPRVADSNGSLGTLTKVRFEMYPGPCAMYSPWNDVGGVAIEFAASTTDLGTVSVPVPGQDGAFRIDGGILSSSPITEGRVHVDAFQTTGFKSNGVVEYGSFASGPSRGTTWTGGVGWPGEYLLFIEDKANGRKMTVLANLAEGSVPTVDLDAICFGFEVCTESPGSPPPTAGTFHPLDPVRILDTRKGLGITNGPVRSGDGRSSDPSPAGRADEAANHELQVTGRFGVPDSGVSAVLLNVTAVDAPGVGFLSVVPKPARVGNAFDDQSSYGALPTTSSLNVGSSGAVANMVLARVGAGGKIRFFNSFGPTSVIADIAGYFGTGGAHLDGAGFDGVVPVRLMDTRSGIGGPQARFAPGEIRNLKVAGVGGIPADAESVVLNLTMVGAASDFAFVSAYPKGQAPPDVSSVNGVLNGVRANQAVVKVGQDGEISLFAGEAESDLLVDVLGSFGKFGGRVTGVEPVRAVDSRNGVGTPASPMAPFETRSFTLRGTNGIPANATAIIANLTATNTTAAGFFTAWPDGSARPNSSNLNFLPGQTVPNMVMLELGPNGAISVYNDAGSSDVLLDVTGYVS